MNSRLQHYFGILNILYYRKVFPKISNKKIFFFKNSIDKFQKIDIILNENSSYLGSDELKNTIQKTAILNALMSLDHPTADEVYECVHSEFPSISKATVYRILNRISEEGEILHLQIPGGADRFDTTLCAHHHLKCNKCGKVCDVDVPELDGIEKRIKEENGFSIGGYRLVFSGLCSDCIFKK